MRRTIECGPNRPPADALLTSGSEAWKKLRCRPVPLWVTSDGQRSQAMAVGLLRIADRADCAVVLGAYVVDLPLTAASDLSAASPAIDPFVQNRSAFEDVETRDWLAPETLTLRLPSSLPIPIPTTDLPAFRGACHARRITEAR